MIQLRGSDGNVIEPKASLTFPGGEPHIELDPSLIRGDAIVVDARVGTADDFLRMLAMADAARRAGATHLTLFLPYFPGARQDRVESGSGNALTAKLYADIINAQRFDRVVIVDPHSDVVPALLERCSVITAADVLSSIIYPEGGEIGVLICPDAGAEKRTLAVSKALGGRRIIHARKHRDIVTGKLDGFELDPLPDVGRYLVVDDICDGGGTFLGLAEQFGKDPRYFGSSLSLYVTHGIFSQGLDKLMIAFDRIISTDSFPSSAHYFGDPRRFERIALWPLFGAAILAEAL